jgi:2-dehydropantoate 2-reductase
MKKKNTDIAIVGAGGMGALFGSILSENGLDVVLIDPNREHVESIESNGLKIEGFGGNRTVRIPAISDASELESANLLFFQCKAHGTRDASRSIRHLLHENSVCISFQNGLGNEEVIAEEVGADKVLGGLTAMAGLLLGPGRIRDFSRVPSYIGEMHGGPSERVASIAEKLTCSGLETHTSEDIFHEIWKKLLGNISMSAVSGLTNLTSATIMSIPELKPVCLQAMEEAFKVAVASGISLDREAVLRGMELISQSGGTGDNKSSLCVDLLNHRETEVDSIYGGVIKLAEEKGIGTPTLKVLHALVKGVEQNFTRDI